MKTRIIFSAIIIFSALTSYSQKTETRQITSFTSLEVIGSFDIELKKGDKESLQLESETIDLADVLTKNEKGLLRISTSTRMFNKDKQVKVTLVYRELTEVSGNAGAQITILSVLEGSKIIVSAGSGSSIQSRVKLKNIEAEAAEGGLISFEGTVTCQTIVVATGGVYDSFGLSADSTFVKANSGGKCKLTPIQFIDAAASTKGYIRYKGEPRIKKFKTTLGGEIEQAVDSEE